MRASHWLLDAPRSLRAQSHRMRHGAGLGWFSLGGEPVRDRAPLAAFENADFDMHARNIPSHTFVAHVRDASVGGLTVRNCHPFVMDDRLFAHNGVVKGLGMLARWLTEVERARIAGETDSELVFAYVTAEIRRHRDTTAGLVEAVQRIGAELPVFSLNLLIAESGRLWALRYPESNELWVLSPDEGGVTSLPGGAATGDDSTSPVAGGTSTSPVAGGASTSPVAGGASTSPVAGGALTSPAADGASMSPVARGASASPVAGGAAASQGAGGVSTVGGGGSVPAVVVASEPMDDRPGWRLLAPGELLVVEGLAETSHFPFAPLSHPVRRSELSLREAASQQVGPSTGTAAKEAVGAACRPPGDTGAVAACQPDEMADSGPMPH